MKIDLGKVMKDHGISKAFVARKLGVSRSFFSHLIKETYREMTPERESKIKDILKKNATSLIDSL